ncbi:hypothetical protein [Paenibacillus kobensis]|uniref:hypothetical protein n=1 Tax=Paenibacillus kobensis TaxID=59841 RepID=UPI000FDAF233|nr:hypothetical protein [Paenibacillus kobensis]
MNKWPDEINLFLQRPVPIFIHLAAAQKGTTPYISRGYGVQPEPERELLWIYILKTQWLRLKECIENQQHLAVLLTSGVDNESYQFKGQFIGFRSLTKQDNTKLYEQSRKVSQQLPGVASLVQVSPSECLAVGIQIRAVYVQTPGPRAGSIVMETERGKS